MEVVGESSVREEKEREAEEEAGHVCVLIFCNVMIGVAMRIGSCICSSGSGVEFVTIIYKRQKKNDWIGHLEHVK